LTKREIIFLAVLGALMIVIALLYRFTSFKITEGWEVALLVFITFPIGFYIATDPERIKKGK